MATVGSVEVSVNLGLQRLLKDADAARLALQDKLSGQTVELNLSTGSASKTLSGLSAQILQVKASLSSNAAESAAFEKQAAQLQELIRYKTELANIEGLGLDDQDLASAKRLAAELNKLNLDKIEDGFLKASKAIKLNEKALQDQSRAAADAAAKSSTFVGRLSAQAEVFQTAIAESSDYTAGIAAVGAQFSETGAQITDFANQAASAAISFDSARAKVATLTDDANGLADRLRELASEMGNQVNSTDLLNASYNVLSSGISDTAEVAEVLKVSSKGALAGFTDVDTVSNAVTTLIAAYKAQGASAKDAARFVDILLQTQDKGKITAGQYASQIGQIASIAGQSNFRVEELSAAIATATANGQDSSSAISGVRQSLVTLLNPTAEAQKYLERFGIANSAAELKTTGLIGVLDKLKQGGASTEELGKIFSDVEALSTVATLAGDNIETFRQNIVSMDNSLGRTDKSLVAVTNSVEDKLSVALNLANELLIDLGKGVTAAFGPLLQVITDLLKMFLSLPAPVKETIGVIIALSGGALTLAGALAAIAAVTPAVSAGFAILTGSTATTTAAAAAATAATTTAAAVSTTAAATTTAATAITGAAAATTTAATAASTASVAVGTSFVGLSTAITGLGTAAAATAPIIVSLLPLLALLAAGVALIEITNKIKEFGDANTAIASIRQSIEATATGAIGATERTKAKIQELNKSRADGTALTAGEIKSARSLFQANEARINQLQQDLVIAQQLPALDAEQANAKTELVASTARAISALQDQNGELSKFIPLGKKASEVSFENANAAKNLAEKYQTLSGELELSNKKQQLAIAENLAKGAISEEQAIQRNLAREKDFLAQKINLTKKNIEELNQLKDDTKDPIKLKEINAGILEAEQSLADARLNLTEAAIAKREEAERASIKRIEDALAAAESSIEISKNDRSAGVKQQQVSGKISAPEADRRLAEIEQISIAETIAARKQELARVSALKQTEETAAKKRDILTDLSGLALSQVDAELTAQQAVKDAAEAEVTERKKAAEERKKLQAEALASLLDSFKKEQDAVSVAETNKITAVKNRQAAGILSEREAAAEIAAINQQSSAQSLAIKQSELTKLEELRRSSQGDPKLVAEQERAAISEIAGLRSRVADGQLAQIEQVKQAKLTALDQELATERASAELVQGFNDAQAQALENRNNLLSAQSGLLEAQSSLLQQRLQFAIEEAERTGQSGKAEGLKKKLLDEQIKLQQQQSKIELEQLRLKQQQNAFDAEGRKIAAETAAFEAKINLEKAVAAGASDREIANLQRMLGLRNMQLEALNSQAAAQARINQFEKAALRTKQQQTAETLKQQQINQAAINSSARGSGSGGVGSSFGGASRSQPTNITALTDQIADLTNKGSLADVFKGAGLSMAARFNAASASIGSGFGQTDISGKLDQLIAATRDAVGRPNLSIQNVDDLGMAGRIYGDISRNSARGAGL